MPVSFTKNIQKHYVLCRMLDEGTMDEVLDYIHDLEVDDDFNKPFYEIVDFTDVKVLDFGYYESNRLLGKYKALALNKGYLGTIFVTGNVYGQAISKMFKTAGHFKGINIRVVQRLDEAVLLIDHLINNSQT
jgi:hypothetical protein